MAVNGEEKILVNALARAVKQRLDGIEVQMNARLSEFAQKAPTPIRLEVAQEPVAQPAEIVSIALAMEKVAEGVTSQSVALSETVASIARNDEAVQGLTQAIREQNEVVKQMVGVMVQILSTISKLPSPTVNNTIPAEAIKVVVEKEERKPRRIVIVHGETQSIVTEEI